jgi:hypothetical protein
LLELAAAELATLKAPKPGEQHSKRTCDLLTSERFGKYLRRGHGGRLEIDRAAVKREERLDGSDTWRNVASRLQTIKVVEYERDGSRIHQTTAVRPAVQQLLKTLNVPEPQKILAIRPAPEPRLETYPSPAQNARPRPRLTQG